MMRIFTIGPVAYAAALRLYRERENAYKARFPVFYLHEFEKLTEEQSAADEILDKLCIEKNTKNSYSRKNFCFDGAVYLREIKEGGICAALWAACEDLEEIRKEKGQKGPVGCEVDIEKIPVDQHVVEILTLAKEDPYDADSTGSWLILSEERIEGGTPVGRITGGPERVLFQKERKRYLTPPLRQQKDIAARNKDSGGAVTK